MGTVELNITELLKDKNLGPEDLANIPGIGSDGAEKLLNGKVSAIRLSTLAFICDALQCEPGDVFRYSAQQ